MHLGGRLGSHQKCEVRHLIVGGGCRNASPSSFGLPETSAPLVPIALLICPRCKTSDIDTYLRWERVRSSSHGDLWCLAVCPCRCLVQLGPFIPGGDISRVPLQIVQRIITAHAEGGHADMVEQVILHVDPLDSDGIRQSAWPNSPHPFYTQLR